MQSRLYNFIFAYMSQVKINNKKKRNTLLFVKHIIIKWNLKISVFFWMQLNFSHVYSIFVKLNRETYVAQCETKLHFNKAFSSVDYTEKKKKAWKVLYTAEIRTKIQINLCSMLAVIENFPFYSETIWRIYSSLNRIAY